ncbi:DUF1289 domain-containing protein [Paroceanicella profunda]|uniref:DUF1289 domain-containing protein n=1 Tax=Paroceanicella profunda TaxID=2579971 RepID=A0A5B8G354_9RHOB|nr:DUF1289 domain-containing protein [Paroceanicella profunda]QDL93113.1 DUF1289 domain-containing protein [Paroceanicella profunda]
MTDEIWARNEIDSPCVKICVMHPGAGLCTGCLRTLDEIAGWSGLPAAERARIMAELPDRRALLRAPQNRPSARRRARRTD